MAVVNNTRFDAKVRPYPGFFTISEITINGVDVSDHWVQISEFEGIFNTCMSAELTLFDTRNLIKNIPIIGEETVVFTKTDGIKTVSNKYRVYDISGREHVRHGVVKYTLHLASEEMWTDSYIRISKSYNKKKFEDNARALLAADGLNSTKTLLAGDTKDVRSIVVPYWSPLHAITWMGCRAQPAEDNYAGGNFVFYETVDGFRFVAMDNLLDAAKNQTYGQVAYDPMRPTVNGVDWMDGRTRTDVMRFEASPVLSKTFNILDNVREGMYANQTRVIDLAEKSVIDSKFDYLGSFSKHLHLGGVGGAPARPLSSPDIAAKDHPEAHLRVAIKRKNLFNDEPDGNSQVDKWLPNKLSQMQQLENYKVTGQLPGHLGLTAGMCLDYYVPNAENVSVNSNPGYDKNYSGSFLVTALRRTFQRKKFWLSVEMVRDSRVTT